MQLSRLSLADPLTVDWHTKRSLLQLHILFLGLFIEPYRDCLVDLGQFRMGKTSFEPGDLRGLKSVEEQCVLAARQSARVASLLQTNNLIRSHCWVSVYVPPNQKAPNGLTEDGGLRYTSYTGCTILLFSASQRLFELSRHEVGQDLLYGSSHLNVLSFCSYDSDIARKLYTTLQIIYNDIREVVVSPAYTSMREMRMAVKDPSLVPSSYYDAVEGAAGVCSTILDLTRRIMDVLQESLSI